MFKPLLDDIARLEMSLKELAVNLAMVTVVSKSTFRVELSLGKAQCTAIHPQLIFQYK